MDPELAFKFRLRLHIPQHCYILVLYSVYSRPGPVLHVLILYVRKWQYFYIVVQYTLYSVWYPASELLGESSFSPTTFSDHSHVLFRFSWTAATWKYISLFRTYSSTSASELGNTFHFLELIPLYSSNRTLSLSRVMILGSAYTIIVMYSAHYRQPGE